MFIKHSFKNIIRSWPKSALFLLLLAALSMTLCIGVSLTSAILDFLKECDENYSTIAVFEYIGVDYPDETIFDPGISQCVDEFDFDALSKNPYVLNWDRNEVAFGSIAGKTVNADKPPFENYIVAVIYIMSYNENMRAYQYAIEKDLIDPDSGAMGGYLDAGEQELELRHFYLIHGQFASSKYRMGSTQYVNIEPLSDAAAKRAGVAASTYDMCADVTTGRAEYEIPEDNVLYLLGQTYATMNTGVTVHATNDLDNLLPFNQAELTIVEGRGFTQDEYKNGARVCVLPKRLAELLEVGVGDQIDLSIAVQEGATQAESYWAGTGFTYSGGYTITGILNPNDDYRDTVFIPKSGAADLSANQYAFTLGQARLKNDGAGRFYEDMRSALPPRVRLSIYDQGYDAAAEPLRDVLRVALIVTGVCALTTLAILALYGFLFVYRQRGLASIMRRNGAANSGIYRYFLYGSSCISLVGAAIGAYISRMLSERVMSYIRQTISNYSIDNLRYSNSALSVSKPMEFMPDVRAVTFTLTALVIFTASFLACFISTAVSIGSLRTRGRGRGKAGAQGFKRPGVNSASFLPVGKTAPVGKTSPDGADPEPRLSDGEPTIRRIHIKSRSLSGGVLKYAWLSMLRGVSRSAIPFFLCAFTAVLLLQLTSATIAYESSFDELAHGTDIKGYITDYRGIWRDNLLVEGSMINSFYYSGLLSDISVTKTMHHGYGIEPPTVWNIYTIETYQYALSSGPGFVFTNDLAAVQEFYGCRELPVTFMEGYDQSVFAYIPPDDFLVADSVDDWDTFYYHESKPIQGIVSTSFLEKYGLAHGDTIWISAVSGADTYNNSMEIIGSYIKQGNPDNIYVPLSAYHMIYTTTTSVVEDDGSDIFEERWYYDIPASYVFDPDPDGELLGKLAFNSLSFSMHGASRLDAFKEFLYDQGYSEVNLIRGLRRFITIEDKTFLNTERTMAQRLWYMQKIFPVLYVLLEMMAALIPFILIKMRKRESALMRAMGAAKSTAFMSLFLEQLMLCLPGVAAGACAWVAIFGKPTVSGLYLTLVFALLWLLGTGVSAFTLNRGSVRTTLRAEE